MGKKKVAELIQVEQAFDYSLLAGQVADEVRSSAQRIRQTLKKTIEAVIEVGNDLRTVKAALPHGQFGAWLRAEFGWVPRTAQNFMQVAERFGPKTEIISDLTIQPTAAYLLAAPSVPDEARDTAIKRAEKGDQITAAVAKQIVAEAKKQAKLKKPLPVPAEKLRSRLQRTLDGYRQRCAPDDLAELARQLHEFANELENSHPGKKKKKRA